EDRGRVGRHLEVGVLLLVRNGKQESLDVTHGISPQAASGGSSARAASWASSARRKAGRAAPRSVYATRLGNLAKTSLRSNSRRVQTSAMSAIENSPAIHSRLPSASVRRPSFFSISSNRIGLRASGQSSPAWNSST